MSIFITYYLPVALWGVMIIGFAFTSGNWTLDLLRAIFELVDYDISRKLLLEINALVRELAHFGEYFVFTLLLWRAVQRDASRQWNAQAALVTLGLVIAVASSDESLQLLRELRTGSVADVLVDTTGGLVGLTAIWMFARKFATKDERNEKEVVG